MARTKNPKAAASKSAKESRTRMATNGKGKTKAALKTRVKPKARADPKHKALFFWDESDPVSGFLSPWYKASFKIDGVTYQSVGHYIMAEKARHFKDTKALEKILSSKSSDEHKALGNKIKGFRHADWCEHAPVAAGRANEEKFLHGPNARALQKKLSPFVDHELVYASPTDNFFGIGLSAEEAGDPGDIKCRRRWGENWFGHSLRGPKQHMWNLANPKAAAAAVAASLSKANMDAIDRLVHW